MENIKKRLHASEILKQHKKDEDALILLLVAVAGISRKLYPSSEHNDSDAFPWTLARLVRPYTNIHVKTNLWPLLGIGISYEGKTQALEKVIYKAFRCNLIHEAELSADSQIIPGNRLTLVVNTPDGKAITLTKRWFEVLEEAVKKYVNEGIISEG
ncbi:MAG: hypothetical protein ABID45_04925 [Patescibacteria group bacterium]